MYRLKHLLMQRAPDDAAAEVAAPGMEAFKTPDVSKPSDVSDVSATEQFGREVDWDDVVDGSADAPKEEEDSSAVVIPPEDEQPAAKKDEPAPEVVKEETPKPPAAAVSDEEAAAAVADDTEEFQPGEITEMHSPTDAEDQGWEENYRTSRDGAMKELESKYQLTEEEADAFLTKPGEIVPQFAARLYVDVFESVLGAVNQMLPVKVGAISAEAAQAANNVEQFYGAWPALRTQEGHEKVTAIGKVYRQLNQDASPEDFMRDVGTQASIALGIPIPGVTAAPDESDGKLPVAPFVPGGAGAGADVNLPDDPSKSGNQFERLNSEWDDD